MKRKVKKTRQTKRNKTIKNDMKCPKRKHCKHNRKKHELELIEGN